MEPEFKPTEESQPISTPTNMPQPMSMPQTPEALLTAESVPSFSMEHTAEMPKSDISMPKIKPSKKPMNKMFLVIALIVVLIAGGVAAYVWRDMTANDLSNQQTKDIATLNAEIKSLRAGIAASNGTGVLTNTNNTVCVTKMPVATIVESIKSSISSGNTAALAGYMASSVNVVSTASGSVVAVAPTQAVTSITDFITSATQPWNFAISTTTLGKYTLGGYAKYFTPNNDIAGLSANGKVISFNFDCDAKISNVLLSPSEDLLE